MHEKGQVIWVRARVCQVCSIAPRPYQVVLVGDTDSKPRFWIGAQDIQEAPDKVTPVTVRCDLEVEHPLTDFKTAWARCRALGMRAWGDVSLQDLTRLCAELAEKGVTAEQFVEGL